MKTKYFCVLSALVCLLSACGDDSSSNPSASTESAADDPVSSFSAAEMLTSSESEAVESSADEILASSASEGTSSSAAESSVSALPANYDPETGILTDSRDGATYKTTQIGDQIWMAQGLRYMPTEPADGCEDLYLDEDEDTTQFAKYGRHYPWVDVVALPCDSIFDDDSYDSSENFDEYVARAIQSPHQGICPEGWHIPSFDEWKTLVTGVSNIHDLLSTEWSKDQYQGTDLYGFNVLPPQETDAVSAFIIVNASNGRNQTAVCDDRQTMAVFLTATSVISVSNTYLRCLMD